MKKIKNILIGLFLVFILVIATLATWVYSQVNSALPLLEGKTTLFGLSSTATVERDEQGIVTITAKTRVDVAVATGFIHAQERFFQMDLLRKNSAGELSSLFGELALNYDKKIRRHRFRDRARAIIKQLPSDQYQLVKAYTRGVNQGLSQLKSSPFEYLLLQQAPVEWQEEDTILTVFSMYLDLQSPDSKREQTLAALKTLGDDVFNFLNPKGSQWDAAIDYSQFLESPLPKRAWPSASSNTAKYIPNKTIKTNDVVNPSYQETDLPGSNNWAVSGEISKTGSAILANDMHLGIRVPNTWFRASFHYKSKDKNIEVTGLTLPGTPNMVVGSNGNLAWGFTNSYGDWSDIIILDTNEDNSQYLTPKGYLPFTYNKQIIAVKGKKSVEIKVKETIWGPVISKEKASEEKTILVYRWVAHDVQAVNLNHVKLETATSVDQAFVIAAEAGIPAQNVMLADKAGNIGWTIMGPIPHKIGAIGDLPSHWASGENSWHGYLNAEEYPKVKNPAKNRLWTANSRVVGGDMLKIIGNGGYALGARSSQIRDRLLAKSSFTEQDLLTIALDDEALFLKRWQSFLLEKVLTAPAIAKNTAWQAVKDQLSHNELRASIDSVAYRLVRNFRLNVRDSVFQQMNNMLSEQFSGYQFSSIRHQIETPLWQLINQQPDNFIWLENESWQALFEQALTQTISDMTKEQPLTAATWGQSNTTYIRHPLSKAVPFIGQWLDMPRTPLAGDSYMPRVQGKTFGASQRMIVSPGHEESGILHMPTSQAGHPWSPYYGKGHSDWEQGIASPFLPGKTKYTLTLLNY